MTLGYVTPIIGDEWYWLSVPDSVSLPMYDGETEEEHEAAVQRNIELYRKHGVEPVHVFRNGHSSQGRVYRSTEIVWDHPPIRVKRDRTQELEWAEEHAADLAAELRKARAKVRTLRKMVETAGVP